MWQPVAAAIVFVATSACLSQPPARSIALVDGDVTAATPEGYCIDPDSSRPADGFAVMAPCMTLGREDAAPPVLGVATMQVGPAGSAAVADDEAALRDILVSDDGAVLLSTKGDPAVITVLGSQVQDRVVKVHFLDASPPPFDGLQDEEWRAFLDMNGRLVTVSVRGLATLPLTDGTGGWLLDSIVRVLVSVGAGDPAET